MMIGWLARYTSLRPSDVEEMEPWQLDAVCDMVREILKSESGE